MPRFVVTILPGLLSAASLTGCGRSDRVELLLEAKGTGASDSAMERARGIIERRIAALGSSGATVVRQPPNRIIVTLPGEDAAQVRAMVGRSGRLDIRLVDTNLAPGEISTGGVPPGTEVLSFPSDGPGGRIPVRGRPIVAGSMIVDAQPGFDSAGLPAVTVRFDALGSRRFARATRENVGRPFAIVLDDQVISAPVINEPILGGQAQISGNFTIESAKQLAIALRSGALPIDLAVIGERRLTQ